MTDASNTCIIIVQWFYGVRGLRQAVCQPLGLKGCPLSNFSRSLGLRNMLPQVLSIVKGKAIQLRPGQAQEAEASRMVRHSSHEGCQPYPPGKIPDTDFCQSLSRLQDHSAAGRIRLMKIFSDPIGNRTRNLPACASTNCATAYPSC